MNAFTLTYMRIVKRGFSGRHKWTIIISEDVQHVKEKPQTSGQSSEPQRAVSSSLVAMWSGVRLIHFPCLSTECHFADVIGLIVPHLRGVTTEKLTLFNWRALTVNYREIQPCEFYSAQNVCPLTNPEIAVGRKSNKNLYYLTFWGELLAHFQQKKNIWFSFGAERENIYLTG